MSPESSFLVVIQPRRLHFFIFISYRFDWMVGFRAEVRSHSEVLKTCLAGEPEGHLRKSPTLFTNDAPVSSYCSGKQQIHSRSQTELTEETSAFVAKRNILKIHVTYLCVFKILFGLNPPA